MNGDVVVLDRISADADRVALCRCGGFGRVTHAPVHRSGHLAGYVRSTFTCTWARPGPHEPLLLPHGIG